jgi:hypothetical protein
LELRTDEMSVTEAVTRILDYLHVQDEATAISI